MVLSNLTDRLSATIRRLREKRDLQREQEGKLNPYRRLIVVTGMARSGTTVTTALLGTHPDIQVVVGNTQTGLLETDLLRPEMGEPDWKSIDELLMKNYPKMVLLKQPWLITNETLFRALRPAKFIICLRSRIEMFSSWMINDCAGEKGRLNPEGLYADNIVHLPRLLSSGATWVFQDQMDDAMIERLGKYLGINPSGFDKSILDHRWIVKKEWMDKYTIRMDRRLK